jgi:hypothetical protein
MEMSYRYYNGTRWIGGTAAFLHQVKEDGGLNEHYTKVISVAIDAMIVDTNKQNKKKAIRLVG